MPIRLAEGAESAYSYPLLIKQLLHTPLATAPNQEIVYRDISRYTYLTLKARIARLAGARQGGGGAWYHGGRHGLGQSSVPRMLLCDSHDGRGPADRERPSHSRADRLHTATRRRQSDSGPPRLYATVAGLREHLPGLNVVIRIDDGTAPLEHPSWAVREYEEVLGAASDDFHFDDFDEDAIATTFYTTGTTGDPKGVCFSHRQIVLHTLAVMSASASAAYGQSFRHGDVYMPLTPMFHVHAWGIQRCNGSGGEAGLSRTLCGRRTASVAISRVGDVLALCPHHPADALECSRGPKVRPARLEICIGGSALPAGLLVKHSSRVLMFTPVTACRKRAPCSRSLPLGSSREPAT